MCDMKNIRIMVCTLMIASGVFVPRSFAEESVASSGGVERARVLEVVSQETREVAGTGAESMYQTLRAEILTGKDKGRVVTVENDYLNLSRGDEFYALHTVEPLHGIDAYNVQEPYRLPVLGIITALFVLTVLAFGGKQGARGLVSLIASLGAIVYLLLPGILAGYPPVLVSTLVSALIIVVGSYITHGVNRTTSAAVLGMLAAICVTGALAYWSVYAGNFSGHASEEITFLFFNTQGKIDLVGLFLGGIMIGLLGILYDAAIGQAVAVEELKRAGTHLSMREVYQRALRIGREHIGALVDTLAIAYVGAALPLLLLLKYSSLSIAATVNQEVFASEIVRTMVGGIGLVLAVPLTTLIAVWLVPAGVDSGGHGHHH